MFCANELKAQMARKGYTQKRLAEAVGVTNKTLYLKIKSGKFGTDEVERIMDVLEIQNPVPIFFADK